MPWKERSRMDERRAFVEQVRRGEVTVTACCRDFGISRATAYRLLARVAHEGEAGLRERSRRPRQSPAQLAPAVEAQIVDLRHQHPCYGGRKLRRMLERAGVTPLPSASTVTACLRRQGLLDPAQSPAHRAWQRFEAPAPNALWQLDAKGPLRSPAGHHLCTVLDDHARYVVGLSLQSTLRRTAIQPWLERLLAAVGMPEALLVDNGVPWGSARTTRHTQLTVHLMRYGIRVIHSRPYHPQTLGKIERWHRTFAEEVLARTDLDANPAAALAQCQAWRTEYNEVRPHTALDYAVPVSRWQPSPRPFPATPPPLPYALSDTIRRVQGKGEISFHGRECQIGRAFRGQDIAIRPTLTDGVYTVVFCTTTITTLDLREPIP